jgi:hypothetical protein
MSSFGVGRFIALEQTKTLIDEGKDARALSHTARRQALLATRTRATMQRVANEERLMSQGTKALKQTFDAIKNAVMAAAKAFGVASDVQAEPSASNASFEEYGDVERFVRGRFVVDSMDDVKAKAAEKLEEKLFEALAGPGEDSARDAQKSERAAQGAHRVAKRAAEQSHSQRGEAQRLAELIAGRPAGV